MTGRIRLTAAQLGIWFAQELAPDSAAYTTAEVVRFDDGLDTARWEAALRATYADAEPLRTRFGAGADGPWQEVVDRDLGPLEVVTVDSPDAARTWLRARIVAPLDPRAGRVTDTACLRLPDGAVWWFHAAHHLVMDHVGFQLFARQVAAHYAGRDPSPLPSLADIVAAEHVADETDLAWWRDLLDGAGPAPTPAESAADVASTSTRVELALDTRLQHDITAAARTIGVPVTTWLTAMFAGHLARLTVAEQVRLGQPQMCRPAGGVLARAVTTCVNVVPLVVATAADTSLAELARGTAESLAGASAHAFVRTEKLARLVSGDLLGPQLNLLPFAQHVGGHPVDNLTAGPVADVTWCVRGRIGSDARLQVDGNPARYSNGSLQLQAERLVAWLSACALADPGCALADVETMPRTEHDLVVERFNDTAHEVPDGTLRDAFLAQAARTPGAAAVRYGDDRWTYAELLDRAGRVASVLGPRPGRVAVALPRGLDLYAAVHAIVLAGGSYVPVDPDLPDGRLATLLTEAAPSVVLGDRSTLGRLAPSAARSVDVSELWTATPAAEAAPLPNVRVDPGDEAYVLFTSGSTGRPKGVRISHRAIAHRLAWMQHRFAIGVGDVVLHKTPVSFDVSVWELFWPLQTGAEVLVAEPGGHRDPRYLAELFASGGVTVAHFVPSMLRAFLADPASCRLAATGRLRHLVCSGEALTRDLVGGVHDVWGVWPVNLYGPTEAAIDVTCFDCAENPAADPVPIGRPIWNTRTLVLDADGRPVPVGTPGELQLGGVQLAEDYLGRPDLTAAAFVPDPLHPGERLYRTGDLVRWDAAGLLHYLGRIDSQVKIRGQRIEPGEVEALLRTADGVRSCAVVPCDGRLVAFVVAASWQESTWADLCAAQLSAAMRPAGFVRLEQLPTTPSGKTDVKALTALAATVAPPDQDAREQRPPATLLVQQVVEAFTEVLAEVRRPGRPPGAQVDFFGAGGDSLSAVRLTTLLSGRCGVDLRLRDLFDHPTPAGLAERIRALRSGGPGEESAGDLAEVLVLRAGAAGVPPVVALPPAAGLGWCWTSLLSTLPAEQGLVAVQGAGLDGSRHVPPDDLGMWADHVLDRIESCGPVLHLIGWSVGGMLAQVMAARAPERGLQVATVTLLDAYPSTQWSMLAMPTEAEALRAVLRIAGLEHEAPADLDRASTVDLLASHGSALAALPKTAIDASLEWVITSAGLVRGSAHPVADCGARFWRAGAPRDQDWLDPDGWRPLFTGELTVHTLDAHHGQLLTPPHAAIIGRQLAEDTAPWRRPVDGLGD